jgi:hypothetical protein
MIDAPIVWDGGDAQAPIPNVLETWAAVRGLRLVAPSDGGSYAIGVDATIAQHVEEDLHQARELIAQHDADGTERALARAEALLRAHPELPQAAWLMAEVERGWSSRFARLDPTDPARAARHWRAAAALDGGRAAGVGETGATPDAPVSFTLDANTHGDEVRWDGELIAPGSHTTRPGAHQLVAKRDGVVVFAQWIAVAQNDTRVSIALPTAAPCTRGDLATARTCATWVWARRSQEPSTFVVRVCAGVACGPELTVAPIEWAEAKPNGHHGVPTWAKWTLAGVSVAAVLGVVAGIITYFVLPPLESSRFITSSPQ